MAATASVSAIRAGQAFVELFVRDTSFTKGLDIAKRQFMAWGKAFVGVGAGISAAGAGVLGLLGGAVNSAAQYGKKLSDASARTGVAADTLSALGFAAEQSGANFEEMEVAIRRFQN